MGSSHPGYEVCLCSHISGTKIHIKSTNLLRWIISRKIETLQQLWQWLCQASKSMWLLCQIISYLEADSYTSAIRNAISLGGDADTMACMAGGIAVVVKK